MADGGGGKDKGQGLDSSTEVFLDTSTEHFLDADSSTENVFEESFESDHMRASTPNPPDVYEFRDENEVRYRTPSISPIPSDEAAELDASTMSVDMVDDEEADTVGEHSGNIYAEEEVTASFPPLPQEGSIVGGKLYNKKTCTNAISKALGHRKCCRQQCVLTFTARQVTDARKSYWSKSVTGRRQWLFDVILSSSLSGHSRVFHVPHRDAVCRRALLTLYGISNGTMGDIDTSIKEGAKGPIEKPRKSSYKQAHVDAILWLENYTTFHGDRMPHKDIIVLPHGKSKLCVYKEYKADFIEDLKPFVCKSVFYKLWTDRFPHVRRRKKVSC